MERFKMREPEADAGFVKGGGGGGGGGGGVQAQLNAAEGSG